MIEITRASKLALSVRAPVLIASGVAGWGAHYQDLINLKKVGALITNPVTYHAWTPARGTRVVPLDAGVLVHTGLPNAGVRAVIKAYRAVWAHAPLPILLHVVGTTRQDVRGACQLIDQEESLPALELGLNDDISAQKTYELVKAACEATEKPVLVRLPMYDAYEVAGAAADAGAGALVVCAPPRGTARDPRSGRLVSGRIYSPLLHPMALRMVGVLRQRIDPAVPIIGAGGVHSLDDARNFIEAGAVAVQVDSVTWVQPNITERIARDLSGGLVTRESGVLADEWHADMGDTFKRGMSSDDEPAQESR